MKNEIKQKRGRPRRLVGKRVKLCAVYMDPDKYEKARKLAAERQVSISSFLYGFVDSALGRYPN